MSFADRINPEVKRQILEERASALIIEGYQNELVRDTLTAVGDDEQAATHTENIVKIEAALEVVEAQILALD